MCGIVGYSSTAKHDASLRSSMEAMDYRGPDSNGEKSVEFNGRHIGVGHVRLKVLDLDNRSSQPFVTQSGNSLIVFNGEIYNYLLLREMLPEHSWKTTSDTEVIAELLERFGDSVVSKFNGIYAVARVCLLSGRLTLFRDPLGVKPLYYYINDNELFFSSEIKALSQLPVNLEVSSEDLLESLNFGYVHEPNTGFKHIKKVPPSSIIDFNEGKIHKKSFVYHSQSKSFTEKGLVDAMVRQTISDVPIGTFFSAGADSTVIASQVEGDLLYINTRLDKDDDSEEKYAKELSETFNRKLLISTLPEETDFKKILELVDGVVDGVEEPISDLTYTASRDLAAIAKEQGFTVMLSGMGADELFGGYLRYYFVKYKYFFNPLFRVFMFLNLFKKTTGKHKLDRIRNYLNESNFLRKYARLVGYFSGEELKLCVGSKKYSKLDSLVFDRLYESIPSELRKNELSSVRFLEMRGFLSHNLIVADKSSMRSSIELRVPLLDMELVASWFGTDYKKSTVRDLGKKPLIKLLRNYIPFKWSPFSKAGFNPPISKFFNSADQVAVENVIFSKDMLALFDEGGLKTIVNKCYEGDVVNFHKIWQLVFISRWLHQWNNFSKNNKK